MFPTFSGSSRRPRNVNMSGQKNVNPFAATSWTPTSSTNASKTVADAQAERNKRQYEREKLKAAQSIQRTWRGHTARQSLKDQRRATLDALYGDVSSHLEPRSRASRALPLVVASLDPRTPDDRTRLERFAQDLLQTDCSLVKSDATASGSQIKSLTSQLLVLLRSSGYDQVSRPSLEVTIQILSTRFESARDSLDSLYDIIANYCRNGENRDAESLSLLEQAILVPIAKDNGRRASTTFALCFLTQPNLELFEGNVGAFAERIDTEKVSAGIVEAYAAGWASTQQADARLWLLAHFIALGNATRDSSLGPSYLHALYIQLSSLHVELKKYHIGHATTDSANPKKRLPPFIETAIQSLVEKDEISHVLERFTTNFAGSSQEESKEASLLAAYILTLIRCFPALSDDIRMRLYLADIPSYPNSVKFFWNAMARTKIFLSIMSDERGTTLDLLQGKGSKQLALVKDDAVWDREWRTILLFLELYVFVLRLTDDEDFFSTLGSASFQSGELSRLRQCMLTLGELKSLTLFLRNLAFTLYYHANDLRQHASKHASRQNTTVQTLFGSQDKATQETSKTHETYSVISGVDFDTFRNTITQAMRMVYERDSRQRFLPRDHWLMTSRFDMEGFKSAVVAEDQRQRELQDAESDDEDIKLDDDSDSDEEDAYITTAYTSQALRNARLERMRAAHKQEQRKLQAATVAPKLEILRNMPFVIPFDTRVKIFREFVHLDKIRRRDGHVEAEQWRMSLMHTIRESQRAREVLGRHSAKVRRGMVFKDAFDQFYDLQDGLKEPIQITFVDQFDIPEAGIDGGGVTKEFLMSATKEAFTDEHSLFAANSQNSLYPNPCAIDQRQQKLRESGLTPESEEWRESMSSIREQYEFLGRIIGKCLYEGILIDVVFAGFFLLKWAASASDAGYRANINDLRELDQDLYLNMMKLKTYPGDVSELGLDFTIDDQISMPNEPVRITTRKLAPDGDKMTVTNENKLLYINYVARHRLVAQPSRVTQAFLKGLGAIIEPAWMSMFNQSELQRLVGGDSTEIDVEDLRRNTVYSGLYQIGDDGEEHPVIKMFWEVLHGLQDSERRDVLKYVTSTPRAPLLGFGQLRPAFSIRDGGGDTTRLPSASTCVNLLKLPLYDSAAQLRDKLLYAVSSGAGFDLS
ncbi:ubiquitin-protein ligase (E3) [Diaporthe australafricana]|uniref:HECT-type E3 ubiquitin transferase n=1 Tax=Diaporthe australafricana TaxID=127596 RepID=A0ABR3W7H7_9PEZI